MTRVSKTRAIFFIEASLRVSSIERARKTGKQKGQAAPAADARRGDKGRGAMPADRSSGTAGLPPGNKAAARVPPRQRARFHAASDCAPSCFSPVNNAKERNPMLREIGLFG